jgi:hypothetical protein
MHLVNEFIPSGENGRNSEGAFVRLPSGRILFAYSRFMEKGGWDNGRSDIALSYSDDEGETWSEPRVIVEAAQFGVKNIMSVSKAIQNDGRIGLYFMIKENNGASTMGRAITTDGETFEISRCRFHGPANYYVVNNDRLLRMPDGRLAFPAGRHGAGLAEDGNLTFEGLSIAMIFVSDDDGASFSPLPFRITIPALVSPTEKWWDMTSNAGMQEPGLIFLKNGTAWLWARTGAGAQYECYSHNGLVSFTPPSPSPTFTGPCSPLEVERDETTGTLYAAYNPLPPYPGREYDPFTWARTPFVIRKSTDEGRSWSKPVVVEDDPSRGYCYPSMFFTKDGSLLLAYCRGGHECANCLCRLGIMKIALSEI